MALAVKRKKQSLPWLQALFVVILIALMGVMGWYTFRWYVHGEEPPVAVPVFATADPRVDETDVTPVQVVEHQVGELEPRYLSIPKLSIGQTRVFSVGLDENGAMGSPANISDTAWYNRSNTPGSGGVVLVDGHNGGITRNGVFAELHSLQVGDIIEVERGDGEMFRYEVRENQSMELSEVNSIGMQMMMESAEEGREALNIITCDGKWVPRYQQFDRRIMLRAVLVE